MPWDEIEWHLDRVTERRRGEAAALEEARKKGHRKG
jgi:hypothetical protein